MKTVRVQNIAPGYRQVTLHGNSGKTWHLPPLYTAEIPENEIIGNKMVEKLEQNKYLCRRKESKPTKKKTTKTAILPKSKSSRSIKSKPSKSVKARSKTAKKK